MKLETKWFLYILKINDLLNDSDLSEIEANGTLDECVAAVFSYKLQSFKSEEESAQFSSVLSEAKSMAINKANEGQEPPAETHTPDNQPSSSNDGDISSSLGKDKKKSFEFIRKLLSDLKQQGASDLHFTANACSFIRKDLVIKRLDDKVLSREQLDLIAEAILTPNQLELLSKDKTISFALSFGRFERYRVTIITHKEGLSICFHIVSEKIKSFEELGFSKSNIDTINYFLSHHNGLILVTGPIGCGKTTTLATMVDAINKERNDHILMVENPIEIVQESIKCNVTQREIINHTQSYANAIKASLREDPDIIIVGELNDLETIEIAIKASETGHLVIGTLQTADVANTLNRLINTFPPFQQPQIKAMISTSLRGIICQKLLPKKNGGIAMATEILSNNLAVANTINEGKLFLLKSIMQTASKSGMTSMDVSIFELFNQGIISKETALLNITDKKNYEKLIESAK